MEYYALLATGVGWSIWLPLKEVLGEFVELFEVKMMLVLYVAQFLAEISDKNGVETKAGEAGDSVVGSGRVSKVDGW